MNKDEYKNPANDELDRDFIVNNLGLVSEDNSDFFRLRSDIVDGLTDILIEKHPLDNPETLIEYFDGIEGITPDSVCRPQGDTTFFTTAGVQHIETLIRETGILEKVSFVVAQPVVRSQFMDRVKEGTSTAFINFSVESVGGTPGEFVKLCSQFIRLVADQGVDAKKIAIQIETGGAVWGKRKFSQTYLTVYFDGTELGECVYIHDYPVTDTQDTSVIDISYGVERLNWGVGKSGHYFPGFEKFYEADEDADKIASIIDCVRTAVLLAGEGVEPSHRDPGYRLRQLSKRFVTRSQGLDVDISEMINISYKYWQKWGFKPTVSEERVEEIIRSENDRSYNVLILSLLERRGGPKIYINVNQPTVNFFERVGFLPKDVKKLLYGVVEEIK